LHESSINLTGTDLYYVTDVGSARTLRRQTSLTQFETAQLANLCPSTADEAKSIIPRSVSNQICFIAFSLLVNSFSTVSITRSAVSRNTRMTTYNHYWMNYRAWESFKTNALLRARERRRLPQMRLIRHPQTYLCPFRIDKVLLLLQREACMVFIASRS